jgi:hypothetical protein
MNKRGFRRVAVFVSTAALTGGVVAGCGSDAATNSGSSSGSTQQQQSGQQPPGGGMDVTALAKALGVSTSKLQAAMQKNRPQPGQQGQGGSRDDMAANLAKELGLSEAKVKAALDKLRPQGRPPGAGNGQAAPSVTPSNSTTS